MDLDWCPCGVHIEGKGPYCSQECHKQDRFVFESPESASSSNIDDELGLDSYERREHTHTHSSHRRTSQHVSSQHVAQYDRIKRTFDSSQGHDRDAIVAWACEIPLGCGSTRPESLTYGSPKLRPPTFPLSRQRPVPPALCMSTTQTQSQSQSHVSSKPLDTSSGQRRRTAPSSAQDGSTSSLVSALTDSIATPMSEHDSNAAVAPAVRGKTGVLDGLTTRLGWCNALSAVDHQKQTSTKAQGRGFTVLSTAHVAESDKSDPFGPFASHTKSQPTYACEPTGRGVMIAMAQDVAYQRKERAPVSLKVERMYAPEEDHPAYRTRGRKAARASSGRH